MNSNMVKPEKFGHLHLVYHFTVPLNEDQVLEPPPLVTYEKVQKSMQMMKNDGKTLGPTDVVTKILKILSSICIELVADFTNITIQDGRCKMISLTIL